MASSASHSISDDATFITALKQKPAVESKNADTEGMARVKNLHSQLLGVVGTLNEKVGAVLAKQEREFLRAYRAHMYTIQRELQTLRAKADDAAIQLAKNEKIRSLEAERDWYRSEALRLDQFCTGLKADVGYMRDKLLALEEDRSWLEGQAKAAMRANKILTARLNGSGLQGGISGSDVGTFSITMAGRPKAAAAGGANNLSNTNGGNTRNNLSSRGLTGISSRYSGASVDVDGLEADAADAQSLAQSRDTGAYGAGAGAVTGSLAMGEASLDQHKDLGGYNNDLSNSNSNGNGGNAGHGGAGAGGGSAGGAYRPSVTGSRVVDSTALTEVEEVEEEGEDAEGSNEEDGDDDAAAGGVHARARNRRGLHRSQQQQQQLAAQQQRRSAGAASKFSSPPSKAHPSPSASRPPFGSNSTTAGGAQQSTARRTSQDTQLSAVQAGIAAALGLGGSGAGAASPARPAAGSAARAAQSLSSPVGQQQQYSGGAGSADQLVVAMQAQVEQLTSQVQRLNQRNAKLRAKNSRLVGGKSEAEQLLLAAIEETRKDVVRRRLKAATQDSGAAGGVRRSTDHRGAHGSSNNISNQHGSTSPGGRSSSPAFGAAAAAATSSITNPSMTQGAVEAALLGDSGLNATLELARAARVTPADFKAADRKALVAKLLEDDRVLERLKELLLAGAGDE